MATRTGSAIRTPGTPRARARVRLTPCRCHLPAGASTTARGHARGPRRRCLCRLQAPRCGWASPPERCGDAPWAPPPRTCHTNTLDPAASPVLRAPLPPVDAAPRCARAPLPAPSEPAPRRRYRSGRRLPIPPRPTPDTALRRSSEPPRRPLHRPRLTLAGYPTPVAAPWVSFPVAATTVGRPRGRPGLRAQGSGSIPQQCRRSDPDPHRCLGNWATGTGRAVNRRAGALCPTPGRLAPSTPARRSGRPP